MMKMKRLACLLVFGWVFVASAAEVELTREMADRYEAMLLRSPGDGAAFDRVVEWYSTEGGGLEALDAKWANGDGEGYSVLRGMLAEELRQPGVAREYYLRALDAEDAGVALAGARLLAELETSEGDFAAAAGAYERALASESLAPLDRMELMRALALVHQRAFEDEKALAVWRSALERYPDDSYVLEEAGEAFLASGEYEEARGAFEQLREAEGRDPFRKVAASLRLARVAELAGEAEEAVAIFDRTLEETSEGSWINREVRARIEELFRRKDDLPGLLAYYEKRSAAFPRDAVTLAARAEVLGDLGRGDEAIEQLRAARELAPEDRELRVALIRRLVDASRTDEALEEASELARSASAPEEAVILLGDLQWGRFEDTSDEGARTAAIAAWRRMAPEDSDDVGAIARLAEIFSAHELTDEAVEQWERIVALSPGASDARMRLAGVMMGEGDEAGAKAVLAGLVEGELARSENFLTLAGLQAKLEWEDEAGATLERGLSLFPEDYDLLSAAYRRETEREGGDPGELFGRMWRAAPNGFFADDVVRRQASWLESSEKSEAALAALRAKVAGGSVEAVDVVLAFQLAVAELDETAAREALNALKGMDEPTRAARAGADFAAAFGSLEDQIVAKRAVAAADPRLAVASLQAVAQLQADLGLVDEALATVEEVIDRSPADASVYGLYADLASAAGRFDAAVERLQDGMRVVDDGTTLRLQMVDLLASQARFGEAAEVLQEAFEREESEGRRMDIFRRQIEVAMASGRIDDLIAKLRERQAREEGGARYGTYLAEIFIQQNDFISAREELSKSLGRNPDDPAAIQKMMDLAERGGDQVESLRLAARLAEVEPSDVNRAEYLERLIEGGDVERAKTMVAEVRGEMVKDPAVWAGVLAAMRQARLDEEYDKLVRDISLATGTSSAGRLELAKLQLGQGEIEGARETLWKIVTGGEIGEAVSAVLDALPANGLTPYQVSPAWLRMQALNQLAATLQSDLGQLMGNGGGRNRYFFSGGLQTSLPGTLDPEMKARVSALVLLNLMSRAENRQDEYYLRVREILRAAEMSVEDRVSVFLALADQRGLKELVREQADADSPDLEADKLLVSMILMQIEGLEESMKKIRARVEARDPGLMFGRLLVELSEKFTAAGAVPTTILEEGDKRAELREGVEELRSHPGYGEAPGGGSQLAMLAARTGDFEMAFELLDDAEASDEKKAGGATVGYVVENRLRTRGTLIAMAMLAGDPEAEKRFEEYAESAGELMSGFYSGRINYGQGSRQVSPLAAGGSELVIGDEALPFGVFSTWMQLAKSRGEDEKLRDWFAENATGDGLNAYVVASTYGDWLAGEREEAIQRIETIHAEDPTPRTAAFLLELTEKNEQPERALEVIDQAALQASETAEVRSLRRLRLLRAAGREGEARELGEKLARGRVSASVRDQLVNELNSLGVAPAAVARLSNFRRSSSRGQISRWEMLRDQMEKLVDAGRTDDAEQIALAQLGRPLPSNQDYDAINTRNTMLRALESMERIDSYTSELRAKLEADPGDIDAAIRLAEEEARKDGAAATIKLIERMEEHPERVVDLGAALRIAQRSGNGGQSQSRMVAAVLERNPSAFGSAMQVSELMQYANGSEGGARIARTLAGLDEEDFNRLFFTQRLVSPGSESGMLAQFGGFAAQEGETDVAVKLLERALDGQFKANGGIRDVGLGMQLVGVLQKAGRTEAAAEVFRDLLKPNESVMGIYRSSADIASYLSSMVQNQQNRGVGPDPVEDIAKLAEATGTVDLLLKTLDDRTKSGRGIPVGLLVRSALGRPGSSEEWLALADQGEVFAGYAAIPTIGAAIKALAGQPDAKEVLPKFLEKLPEAYASVNGDAGLQVLIKTLPLLEVVGDNSQVGRFADSVVGSVLADTNSLQYLPNSQNYGAAIRVLTQAGFVESARRLFDVSSSQRATATYGNRNQMDEIEANLLAAEGNVEMVEIVCLAVPTEDAAEATVRWQVRPAVKSTNRNNEPELTTWDAQAPELPGSVCPETMQIFAGSNPATLEAVATVSKPGSSGEREVKLPGRLGVLQARWNGTDGEERAGPLSVYVVGAAVEGETVADSGGGSLIAVPGPLGGESGRSFSGESATSDWKYPLLKNAEVDLENLGVYALVGWVSKDDAYGSAPSVETRWRGSDDKTFSETHSRSRSDLAGRWAQLFEMWAVERRLPSVRSLDEKATRVDVEIQLNSGRSYNNTYLIDGAWDGMRLVRLDVDEVGGNADDLLAAARTDLNDKKFDAAVDGYFKAIRRAPERVLSNEVSNLVRACQGADRLDELFAVLANPALYQPNPLINGGATASDPRLIDLLASEALGEDSAEGAKRWLSALKDAPLADSQRFVIDAAILREQAKVDAASVTADQVIELFGFQDVEGNEQRLRDLWGRGNDTTVRVLKAMEEAGQTEALLKGLRELHPPVSYQAGVRLLEAWLEAGTDAEEATRLWEQSLAMRRGENRMNFSDAPDREVLTRIGANHPKPGNVIAVVQGWVASANRNERQRQRELTEALYELREVGRDEAARSEYESAWVDSEIAGLGSPESSVNRERLSAAAAVLLEVEDWDRLERMLEVTDSRRSQLGSAMRAEFERLEKLVSFVRGDDSVAWPVAWAESAPDGETTLHWQWNLRNVDADGNELDEAVTVSDAPLVRTIPGQARVELLFGEMPGEMKPVATVAGGEAEGAVSAKLSSANGFLRAVAALGDRRVEGPLVPIVAGRRLFGEDLKAVLTGGPNGLVADQVKEAGRAPDGSLAVRIDTGGARNRVGILGQGVPVEPSKFYVMRSWVRRTGSGTVAIRGEFRAKDGVDRRPLAMNLCDDDGVTGVWTLYLEGDPDVPRSTLFGSPTRT